MSIPKVSLGMPVYNGAAHLREALADVLAQTCGDFELMVVDNASTDQTEAICREAAAMDRRIRYVRNDTNIGAAPNFNRALELSNRKSPYFKWVAHDDLMADTFVSRCVELLEGDRDAVLAFPRRRFILADGSPCPPEGAEGTNGALEDWSFDRISYPALLRLAGLHMPIFDFAVIRNDKLRRTRRLQSFAAADNVLIAELRLQGTFRECPEALFYQRLHPMSPEWKKRRSAAGQAAWFDPANAHKRQPNPAINLLREQWRAVGHVPMHPVTRLCRRMDMAMFIGGKAARYLNPMHWMSRARERRMFQQAQAKPA